MEAGRIFFRKVCENFEDAVNEFTNVGRWTNDDIADAISMFFDDQVRVMPPPSNDAPANWKMPARPLGFDSDWRKSAYNRAVDPTKDPLGRFGRAGPAVTRSAFNIGDSSKGN